MTDRPQPCTGMLLATGCGGSGGSGGGGDKLTLVAYSTPREAYEQLIPEFQKTQAGKGDVMLAYENEAINASRRSSRSTTSCPTAPS